jgi:hypothetical protein
MGPDRSICLAVHTIGSQDPTVASATQETKKSRKKKRSTT